LIWESPFAGVLGSAILGSHRFIAEIEEKHLGEKQADLDVPDLRRMTCQWSVDEILETVRGVLDKESRSARKLSIYLCHRYSGARLKEIGARFGIGAAGVSQESRRFAIKVDEDGELRKIVDDLREKMKCVNV